MTHISTQSLIHTFTSKGEKAFFVAFGDYGLAAIKNSVAHIAALGKLDYLYQHKDELLALLAAVEKSLQPKKSTLSKFKQAFSNMFGMAAENMTHLIADLETHQSKLLIENASFRQLASQLTENQQSMQQSLCFIDELLTHLQQTANHTNAISRVTKRKIQIQQQQLVVNNALLAITASSQKNKEIVTSIRKLLSTGLSAYLVHDIANKLMKP